MVFASSPISVEKSRVGPGVAGGPKKLDRCGVKHEIVALILTGIRRSREKRRRQIGRRLRSELRLALSGKQGGGSTHPPSKWIAFKTKELREKHFVSG